MKPSRLLLCLSLCLMAGAGFAKTEKTVFPKEAPFSDENTGVVFPAALGAFRKTEIRINPNLVIGTRIQYSGNRPGCIADIYIYALSERAEQISEPEFLEHYRKLREAVFALKEQSSRIEEVESVGQWRFSPRNNNVVWREEFIIHTDGEETYRSEMVLFRFGDRVVKLKITVPSSQKEAVEEAKQFITGFLKLFFKAQTPVFLPYRPDSQPKS